MKNESLTDNAVCDTTGNMSNKNDVMDSNDITSERSGIYKIINNINGKYYVGSTDDFYRRKCAHFSELKRQKHGNKHLQNAWNKYGKNVFEFVIIEKVPINRLLEVEQKYLNHCKEHPSAFYNISYDAVAMMKGRNHSKETKLKMSKSQIGHYVSPEQKSRQSKVMKGRLVGSKNPNYGKRHSAEIRAKMGTPNPTIFFFKNLNTQKSFSGTRLEFGYRFGIDKHNIFNLIHRRAKTCRGWILCS